jgi:hypothetical protein
VGDERESVRRPDFLGGRSIPKAIIVIGEINRGESDQNDRDFLEFQVFYFTPKRVCFLGERLREYCCLISRVN